MERGTGDRRAAIGMRQEGRPEKGGRETGNGEKEEKKNGKI